ncbi:hypothetical protein [Paraburkholderia elongata]|uniref:Uncharacterized protein n=1 Tax=Paraburkholderia elongata TaxID=2675747 RepID=A0A972NU00_9BURK|nr:hypothetical protein [Paraburkholderia elongata]NPT59086.1 hypothetical protein [Paraburkholderia elongata]
MTDKTFRMDVPLGFDGDGYQAAIELYVAGLVGRECTTELRDEVYEKACSMAKDFVKVGEVIVSFD